MNKKPKSFEVVQLSTLHWPSSLEIPTKRFRLFLAADASHIPTETISEFANEALQRGMVYFSAWGPDCERVHDIVDEVAVEDELGGRKFEHPSGANDVVMTTWHEESLEEGVSFFTAWALPSEGYAANSEFWVALIVGHPEWAASIRKHLQVALAKPELNS